MAQDGPLLPRHGFVLSFASVAGMIALTQGDRG